MQIGARIITGDEPCTGNAKLKKAYGADYIEKIRAFAQTNNELKRENLTFLEYIEYKPSRHLGNNYAYFKQNENLVFCEKVGIPLKTVFGK